MPFSGKERGDRHAHDHAHESPPVMTVPLGVLAIGAIFGGMVWYNSFFGDHAKVLSFFGLPAHEVSHDAAADTGHDAGHDTAAGAAAGAVENREAAMAGHGATTDHGMVPGQGAIFMAPGNTVLDDAHHVPVWVRLSPFVAMLLGLATAWLFYIRDTSLPRRLAAAQPALHRFLLNKWYFDELYDAIFVRPAFWLGRFFWKKGDDATIDGTIDGVAMGLVPKMTRILTRMQSGYLFHYAFAMVVGIVVLMLWVVLNGGAQ